MAPTDDLLPAAPHLLGDGARALVGAAVQAHGGRLESLTIRQVLYTPGRSITVRYSTDVEWPSRGPTRETIVALASVKGLPEGCLVLEADDLEVGLFRYPHDPLLPGLPQAVDRVGAAHFACWPDEDVEIEVVTYRPGRRAVVRVVGPQGAERYLKLVPVDEVRGLSDRHMLLAERAPVPGVVAGDLERGVLAIEGLPGVTLREQLRADEGTVIPPAELLAVLDALGAGPVPPAASLPPLTDGGRSHARLLATVVPSSRRRIERFIERLGPDDPLPTRTVHGDFHPAQLLVAEGRLSGLLDVDDVGPGHQVDDLATFLGHVSVSVREHRRGLGRAYLGRCLTAFEAVVDPVELHRRTACAVVGMATGPHRVREPRWREQSLGRFALAERWLRGDVRTLKSAS